MINNPLQDSSEFQILMNVILFKIIFEIKNIGHIAPLIFNSSRHYKYINLMNGHEPSYDKYK